MTRHLIKIALFLLAAVAAYYVYGFTSLVAPPLFAVGAAGSLVGTYVGLAFADIPTRQRQRASHVAKGAMVVEALYGVLYVLSLQSPEMFRAPLSLWISVPLAALHGAAFSVLAYFVSLFVVHERSETEPTPADRRDEAIIVTLNRLVDRLELPAAPRLPDLQETKAETIRRLAVLQIEQGAEVDTDAIARATGYNLAYVQQVVSRWRQK